ncbi:rhodanese-like domain-containing protein [Rhizorhabdus sp.]|uniref:rhodanese-like domain-containing protein n=1 Tax=Rhizorhabdus sp. TaxID=1968843 RepID=UPI0019A3B40F|nr:rhodanese-like domain-containing protein [Rhizorhabdus sp.]MBD3763023.1 rhodanese-like domain-containing protein [Rhizorhabdus sp.]
MTRLRLPLLLTPALLLAACADTRGHGGSSAPLGFELASAASAATGDDGAATTAAVPMIDLTPEQLAERIKAGKVRVIDVRTAEEVAEGMIPGAEHMPLDKFDPAKLVADDGREIVLYCRSGRRSTMAGALLAEVTGQPVQHLAGGIMAWEAAGQPVEKR